VIGVRAIRHLRRASGRNSATWRLKKVLVCLIAIGSLSFLTVNGVYAVFNGQTSNGAGKISSGTLTFTNTVTSGTCNSYAGPASPGNVNTSCGALFTSASLNYPGVPATSRVTITNSGSLDASDLSVYMPTCVKTTTPSTTVVGGGDPCASTGAELYIQETDSSFTPTTCPYPDAAAGACTFQATTLNAFFVNANSSGSVFHLGAGPAHGQSRYFVIGMQLPSNASNTLQGEEAVFALTWHITT
jgi:hypothetical protein